MAAASGAPVSQAPPKTVPECKTSWPSTTPTNAQAYVRRAHHGAARYAQVRSALAKRPYDLRHACLSTWLNAGVPATQVAEWAGNSVKVLLDFYAKCLDGGVPAALNRIALALGPSSPTKPG